MKSKEKEKAIKLRQSGLSYKEILEKVPVSKGSLSYWVRDIQLLDEQKNRIYGKILATRRNFIEYNDFKHKAAISQKEKISDSAKKEIEALSNEELKLIGVALYWAEGYKANSAKYVEFTNSDPKMISFMMRWFREICSVPDDKFRIKIQLHDTADIKEAIEFWSLNTGVPLKQFTKPYIRITPTSKKKAANRLKYGICHIRISDVKLLAKIKGWISGISGPMV